MLIWPKAKSDGRDLRGDKLMKMKWLHAFLLSALIVIPFQGPCQIDEPLRLVQTIQIPGLHDGTFDHFQVDLPGQRLFVAAEDNSAVTVIDLRTNRQVCSFKVPYTPHSIAYDAELKKL